MSLEGNKELVPRARRRVSVFTRLSLRFSGKPQGFRGNRWEPEDLRATSRASSLLKASYQPSSSESFFPQPPHSKDVRPSERQSDSRPIRISFSSHTSHSSTMP